MKRPSCSFPPQLYYAYTSAPPPSPAKKIRPRLAQQWKKSHIVHRIGLVPVLELKECIRAALNYHKVKHLMTLGI